MATADQVVSGLAKALRRRGHFDSDVAPWRFVAGHLRRVERRFDRTGQAAIAAPVSSPSPT